MEYKTISKTFDGLRRAVLCGSFFIFTTRQFINNNLPMFVSDSNACIADNLANQLYAVLFSICEEGIYIPSGFGGNEM